MFQLEKHSKHAETSNLNLKKRKPFVLFLK